MNNNPINLTDPTGHCAVEGTGSEGECTPVKPPSKIAQNALDQYCTGSSVSCSGSGIGYITVDLSFMSVVVGYDPGTVRLPYHINPNYNNPSELFPWEGVADVTYSEHGQLHPNDPYYTDYFRTPASIKQRESDRAYAANHWLGDAIGLMQTMIVRVEDWGRSDTNTVALSGNGQYHTPARAENGVWGDFYGVAFMVTELNVRVDQPFPYFAHQDLTNVRGTSGDRNGRLYNEQGEEIGICCNETIGFGPTPGWKNHYIPIYHDPRFP